MSADREQLERAIQAQESLRGTLGDELVEAAITALREKLAGLGPPEEEARRQVTILFAPDGRLYVAETGRNTVAEIDLTTGKVLRRLPA